MDRTAMRMKMRELLPGVPGDGLDYVLTEALKAGGVDAEAQALREEVAALRRFAGEIYQVLGALDAPENVLDNASDAASGDKLRHETLLPFAALRARALIVPERKISPNDENRYTDHDYDWHDGFNECLDELARLNGKAVSEGLLRRVLNVESDDFMLAMNELRALLGEGKEHE